MLYNIYDRRRILPDMEVTVSKADSQPFSRTDCLLFFTMHAFPPNKTGKTETDNISARHYRG